MLTSLLVLVLASSVLSFNSQYADYRKRIALASPWLLGAPESRIIGGGNAAIEKYPFAVSLQNNGTFFGHDVEHFCGGSILNERWILTTALCALRMHVRKFHVRAGATYYYKDGTIYDVERIVVHPLYDDLYHDHDFGLVKLSQEIIFDESKQPIKLPKFGTVVQDDAALSIVGWGKEELFGPVTDELRHATVSKIDTEKCLSFYKNGYITGRMFCVFTAGVGPCIGDTGSPAVFQDTLVGIMSWTQSCSYVYPAVYANISSVINWITETIDT